MKQIPQKRNFSLFILQSSNKSIYPKNKKTQIKSHCYSPTVKIANRITQSKKQQKNPQSLSVVERGKRIFLFIIHHHRNNATNNRQITDYGYFFVFLCFHILIHIFYKLTKTKSYKQDISLFENFILILQNHQNKQYKMLIIGIAGGTGSGKTTVVHQIMNELPSTEVGIISQDSYYKETSNLSYEERTKINFDHPRAIDFELLVSHLKDLKAGKAIEQPVYSFVTHNRTGDVILTNPRKVMIVEGILILTNPELREMFDVKIFVHADSDERLIRRLKRDISERGRDMEEVLNRYQNTLKPMHEQFIEPTKAFADIIIPNDKYNTVAIDVVRAVINQKIEQK